MSDAAEEVKEAVGLGVPERRQVVMVMQCPDDLVGPTQPVRTIMAGVERLKVSRFCESIKAREGDAERDATDLRLRGPCRCTRRRASWRGAAGRARRSSGCVVG
jgi:hypothetical protein